MSQIQALYNSKKMTAEEAVTMIKDGNHVCVATGVGEPPAVLRALSKARRNYRDVKVMQVLSIQKFDYFDFETAEHVRHHSFFLSAASRGGWSQGTIDTIPNYFSEIPDLIRQGFIPVDVAVVFVSPMDKHGYFSASLGTGYTAASLQKAKTVIVETNPNVPFAYGECTIHISQVSAIVESDDPVFEVGMPVIGDTERAIAGYVAELINDGSTLQIGFGTIPDAVVSQLKSKHDLGIHTEMFGDGIMTLIENGNVTNAKKNMYPGRLFATFALGSKKLYEFMDRNPMVEMHQVDITNTPHIAGLNDNLISINGTLEIDFAGQCCSESMGAIPYSGTGGQADFVRAANLSKGGKSFIVTPSTAKNGTISRIVPMLKPGSIVSTSRNDVSYVVTEYGVAHLRGKGLKQRALELISIAHPDFREDLRSQARAMHLL